MEQEEKGVEARLLAALAHGSAVAQGIGILVGVLVYVTQRDKSRFAAFQALQAAVYQLVNFIIVIGMWIVWGVFYGVGMIPFIMYFENHPDAAPPVSFWIFTMSWVLPLIFMLFVGLFGLWGALRTWQGADFRYPLIGGWLERSGLRFASNSE